MTTLEWSGETSIAYTWALGPSAEAVQFSSWPVEALRAATLTRG